MGTTGYNPGFPYSGLTDTGEHPELPARQPPLPNTPLVVAVYSTMYGSVFDEAGAQFGKFAAFGTMEATR